VSPKAIFTRDIYRTTRKGRFIIHSAEGPNVSLVGEGLKPGAAATGDYYLRVETNDQALRWKIRENSTDGLVLSAAPRDSETLKRGDRAEIQVRLRQPYVDLQHCTGCGICEHECPVSGQRAIRVTAENETRNKRHKLLL
jgi:NAD-dependent dihydropyrimidine dehydrogenase PreA subunit